MPLVTSAEFSGFPARPTAFPAFGPGVPAETELFPAQPPAFPSELAIAPAESRVFPSKPPVFPAETRVCPAKLPVFPAKSRACPAKSRACPAEPEVLPAGPRMVPVDRSPLRLPEDAPAQQFTNGTNQPSRKKHKKRENPVPYPHPVLFLDLGRACLPRFRHRQCPKAGDGFTTSAKSQILACRGFSGVAQERRHSCRPNRRSVKADKNAGAPLVAALPRCVLSRPFTLTPHPVSRNQHPVSSTPAFRNPNLNQPTTVNQLTKE